MQKKSPQDVQKAIKELISTKDKSTGISEAKGIATKTKDTDITKGTRDATLLLINPNIKDGFTHKIWFLESNTTVYARISNELGVTWAPNGKWRKGIFVPTEKTIIHAKMIKDLGKWEIIGAENPEAIFDPGTTTIARNNTTVKTKNNSVALDIENLKLDVRNDWVYLGGKRICVAPCGDGTIPTECKTVLKMHMIWSEYNHYFLRNNVNYQNSGTWKIKFRFGANYGDPEYIESTYVTPDHAPSFTGGLIFYDEGHGRVDLHITPTRVGLFIYDNTSYPPDYSIQEAPIIDWIEIEPQDYYHVYEVNRTGDNWTLKMDGNTLGTGTKEVPFVGTAAYLDLWHPSPWDDSTVDVYIDYIRLGEVQYDFSDATLGNFTCFTHCSDPWTTFPRDCGPQPILE